MPGAVGARRDQAEVVDQKPDVWTIVPDATGTQRINTTVPFGTPPPAPVAAARVAKVLTTQRPLVSDLIFGPVTGTLLTTIYVPAKAAAVGNFVVAQAFSVTAVAAPVPTIDIAACGAPVVTHHRHRKPWRCCATSASTCCSAASECRVALQAGYQAYIVKPVQPHQLIRTIAELVNPHRSSQGGDVNRRVAG